MEFEWDPPKNQESLELRKFDFDFATKIFKDKRIRLTLDERKDYGEKRIKAIGEIEEKLYCVIFTKREDNIRIISARREHTNSKDWRKYYGIS